MKTVEFVLQPVKWLAMIFSEDTGKASFARVAGAVVIWRILAMGNSGKNIPSELMTMFWVLVGYQLVSKLTPAVIDFAKTGLAKVQEDDPPNTKKK